VISIFYLTLFEELGIIAASHFLNTYFLQILITGVNKKPRLNIPGGLPEELRFRPFIGKMRPNIK